MTYEEIKTALIAGGDPWNKNNEERVYIKIEDIYRIFGATIGSPYYSYPQGAWVKQVFKDGNQIDFILRNGTKVYYNRNDDTFHTKHYDFHRKQWGKDLVSNVIDSVAVAVTNKFADGTEYSDEEDKKRYENEYYKSKRNQERDPVGYGKWLARK